MKRVFRIGYVAVFLVITFTSLGCVANSSWDGEKVSLKNTCSAAAYVTFLWESQDKKKKREEKNIFEGTHKSHKFKGGTVGTISYEVIGNEGYPPGYKPGLNRKKASAKSCGGSESRTLVLENDEKGGCEVRSFCFGQKDLKAAIIPNETPSYIAECLQSLVNKHRQCQHKCLIVQTLGCANAHRNCLEKLLGKKVCRDK